LKITRVFIGSLFNPVLFQQTMKPLYMFIVSLFMGKVKSHLDNYLDNISLWAVSVNRWKCL